MLERLFKRPRTLTRHRDGPLAEERIAYLTHLADQGMTDKYLRAAARHLLVIAERFRLAERPGEVISHKEIERQTERWAKRRLRTLVYWKSRRKCQSAFGWRATDWLRFLGRLEKAPTVICPCEALVTTFADYMHRERGLSPETIHNRCYFVRKFLARLDAADGSLREITIKHIDDVILEMLRSGRYARTTIQAFADHLRAFFRYAAMRGWCRNNLADSIRGPRLFNYTSLPRGPSWEDVRLLLATAKGDRRGDIRDRAILMLLAVYGLRAGEVARLRLEDLDWEQELLTIVGTKTRKTRTYPLGRQVGDAILRYLREARPNSAYREVFLSLQAPIQPMHQLWEIVARRWRRLGRIVPHYGAHGLRHSCASHLLAQGLSLKEIGDHLGHSHPDSTRIYAKVDLVRLRQVADMDMGGLL